MRMMLIVIAGFRRDDIARGATAAAGHHSAQWGRPSRDSPSAVEGGRRQTRNALARARWLSPVSLENRWAATKCLDLLFTQQLIQKQIERVPAQ